MNPADELKDILVNEGVGVFGASSGWALFVGFLPDDDQTPDQAIGLINSGGEPSNPKWLLDYPHVQVMVRGKPWDYVATYDKVLQVVDELLGITSLDVNDGRLVSVTALGHINPLGYDEKRRPMFSYNFRLIVEPNASAETNRQAL